MIDVDSIWQWLTKPISLDEAERRQRQTLLSAFILLFIVATIVIELIIYVNLQAEPQTTSNVGRATAVVILFALTYGLTRTKYFRLAILALLLVFSLSISLYLSVIVDQPFSFLLIYFLIVAFFCLGLSLVIVYQRNIQTSEKLAYARESERSYYALLETVFQGIAVLQDGVLITADSRFLEFFQYHVDEIVGRPVTDLIQENNARLNLTEIAGDGLRHEARAIKKDGERLDVELVVHAQTYRGMPAQVIAIRDIIDHKQNQELLRNAYETLELRVVDRTADLAEANASLVREIAERQQVYRQLDAAHDRLVRLSRRLVAIQEEERRRIARELHDEIGQALTAMKINLQTSQSNIAAADPQIATSLDIVDQVLKQVRNLSLDLRPSTLDDLGLVKTLRWYIDRQAQWVGFTPQFTTNVTTRPSNDIEIACFRIVQEALTNIARHADAKHVLVDLNHNNGTLMLSIQDDGRGFDVEKAEENAALGDSMGLLSLKERALLAEGTAEIVSELGEGTEILVTFDWVPRVELNGKN
ncbi:MAG: PAS domain-containing sensor histidine kinase [Chloroflexota bacterium]